MIKLTPHEQKILDLVKKNPEIIHNPEKRKEIAEQEGFTEKTLRNRIGHLKNMVFYRDLIMQRFLLWILNSMILIFIASVRSFIQIKKKSSETSL